jgi:hypothetical protein
MFTALNDKNISVMRLKKIRNAIAVPGEKRYAATSSGLEVLAGYDAFRQELDAAGELGNWEYDLDTYIHCIAVLNATSPVIHPGQNVMPGFTAITCRLSTKGL